jgi:hypothetical protein
VLTTVVAAFVGAMALGSSSMPFGALTASRLRHSGARFLGALFAFIFVG